MAGPSRGFKVRALGEVAIRCANLGLMEGFYRDIIGLDPIVGEYSDHIRFFRIADGFAGHTSVLALFHADETPGGDTSSSSHALHAGRPSSLHHLALTVPFNEQDAAMAWFDANAVAYRVQEFAWVGWRGVFITDPEGNTVELVAYDPSSGVAPPATRS